MEATDLLLNRDSALKLEDPGPSETELDQMLQSAVRAPDHGRLRPWRFVVIRGEQRGRFGDLLAASMRRKMSDVTAEMLQRERDKAMRAPVIVAVAAHVQKGHRIPEIEQLSAVAAAAQTLMLAAPAQGYGAMWKTGDAAYDPMVRQELGLAPDDEIIGFLYIGKRSGGASPPERTAKASDYVSVWAA
jgi:nitroreductase